MVSVYNQLSEKSFSLHEDVDSIELHVGRDHVRQVSLFDLLLDHGLGGVADDQIVAVVREVVVVEHQDVCKSILSVLKGHVLVVEVELLDASKDILEHLGELGRALAANRLDWHEGREVAEKLVGVKANAVFLEESLKDSALVDDTIDHLHHLGVRSLADGTSGELVQDVGKGVKNTSETEDFVLTFSVDRARIIVDFFKAS